MSVCPNISHPDWKELVSLIGENRTWEEYLLNGLEIPNPADYRPSKFSLDNYQVDIAPLDAKPKMHPNGISFYNPYQAETVYRNFLKRTADKMSKMVLYPYDKGETYGTATGEELFMDVMRTEGLDAIDMQILQDVLNHKGIDFYVSSSEEIAKEMHAIHADPRPLETFYKTQSPSGSYFGDKKRTALEKFELIGKALIHPEQWEILLKDFDNKIDAEFQGEQLINPSTGKQMIVRDFILQAFNKYIVDEKRISEIENEITERGEIRGDQSLESLERYHRTILSMTTADNLIQLENKQFIDKLKITLGKAYEDAMLNVHNKRSNNDYDRVPQQDMSGYVTEITSITDFSDHLLGMQYVGREISKAALRSDAEQLSLLTDLESLMKNVIKWNNAHKPKDFVDKFKVWKYSEQQRDIFDWMLEVDNTKDKNDPDRYTGRTIARYKETEEVWHEKAFRRKKDKDGKDTLAFAFSNQVVSSYVSGKKDLLSDAERNRFDQIMRKYNRFSNYYELFQSLTSDEQTQARKDTTFIRNSYIKVGVRSSDNEYFKDLKRIAKTQSGTVEGNLAQAKIDLYDYIYEKNTSLLSENGNEFYQIERANMPQTYADFQEEWSRYGFQSAWQNFWKNSHNQDDNDAISINAGIVVSMDNPLAFANSKSVPYRTLKSKERFSVNVPKIFSHHFSTLIFKKNYDKVMPIMDAVQTYYKSQKKGEFKNVIQFIEDYANQKIFFQKTDFAKSKGAKALRLANSLVVTQFLGLAPLTSAINLVVGVSESYKHLLGEYGLAAGTERYKKGFGRMLFGPRMEEINFSNLIGEKLTYNKKAMAIMSHYGIETFSTGEIFNAGGELGQFQNTMLILQRSSEIMIRGAAFFSEMSDEQWDGFQLDKNGKLKIVGKIPNELDVAEWKNKIGEVQGKYDDETKRLYHSNAVYQSFFLFKGWLIDYMRNRFVPGYRDQFGVEREGYYTTGFRVLKNYKNLLSMYNDPQKNLTKLEQQNLRKIAYDVIFLASLILMQGAFDDDDEKESWYMRQLAKFQSQLYLFGSPVDIVEMVKSPFAGLYHIEMMAKIMDSLLRLQASKVPHQLYKGMPGTDLIEFIDEVGSDE